MIFLRINSHRHRNRQALIAAAGIDDNGQLTATHARIRSRCRHGLRPVSHAVSINAEQRLPDLRTIGFLKTAPGNRHLILKLAFQRLPNVVKLHAGGKLADLLNGQQVLVLRPAALRRLHVVFKHLSILLNSSDIRMRMAHPRHRLVAAALNHHNHIQQIVARQKLDLNRTCIQHPANGPLLFFGYVADHFKRAFRVSRDNSGCNRRGNAAQAACVGHGDAFHVFDDVAAHLNPNPFRHPAQRLSRLRRAICQCNRLCAAGSRRQLTAQDFAVCLIYVIRLLHRHRSFWPQPE